MSKQKEALIYAYNKGYRIDKQGVVTSYTGKVLTPSIGSKEYFLFSIAYQNSVQPVPFHRLQAYTKYGNNIFVEGIVVRHLDGDRKNNSWDNILIGTDKDNSEDIPKEQRKITAIKAAATVALKNKIDPEILLSITKDHQDGLSERLLASKYNLTRSKIRKALGKFVSEL